MPLEGYIKLYRSLLDKPIWQSSTPEQRSILIAILCLANHQEKEWAWNGNTFKAKPGQFVSSLESIAHYAGKGVSIKNVRTSIEKFKKFGFLANESASTGRLITIINWASYQFTLEQPANESADTWQTTGKRLATTKNDKNDKNDKNTPPLPPSGEERARFSDFVKKAHRYLLSSGNANLMSADWANGYLANQMEELSVTRKDLSPDAVIGCWYEACDIASAGGASAPKFYKTVFERLIREYNPTAKKYGTLSKSTIPAPPRWKALMESQFVVDISTGREYTTAALKLDLKPDGNADTALVINTGESLTVSMLRPKGKQ